MNPAGAGSARVRHLPVVHRAPDDLTDDLGDVSSHPMRVVTEAVVADPTGEWSPERAREVAGFFDELAPTWNERHRASRVVPLEDAWERGGPLPSGRCVEIGSGTGLLTGWLAEQVEPVLCIDVSEAMLREAPHGPGHRVLGDAASLPLPDGSVELAVLVNALLFADELDRVVSEHGVVVWVNSRGARTPIHLPAERVVEAFGDGWEAVASEAGGGTWAVLRRRRG